MKGGGLFLACGLLSESGLVCFSLTPHFRGRVVELASNCYGCHVLQKALDCEEDIRLLIVSELLLGDPAQTLVNKHASHVWSKVRTEKFSLSIGPNYKTDHGIILDTPSPSNFRIVRSP